MPRFYNLALVASSNIRPVALIVSSCVQRTMFDKRLPFASNANFVLRGSLRFLRMSFVRIRMPSDHHDLDGNKNLSQEVMPIHTERRS